MLRALLPVYERARRGSVVVLVSDLVDLPERALADFGGLATRGRRAFAIQVLSPDEATLPFGEHARFTSLEGGIVVEADPVQARDAYLAELESLRARWREDLLGRGGALVTSQTTSDPVEVVRELLLAVSGRANA